MNNIPWTQLGIIGTIAVVLVIIVLAFVLKWKGGNSRRLCVNSPEVKQAMVNNQIMTRVLDRLDVNTEKVKDETIKQTGLLYTMLNIQKEQAISLKELVKNGRNL